MMHEPISHSQFSSAQLYDILKTKAQGNQQRTGSLHRLKQACDALVAAGTYFTLRDIEVYCQTRFKKGPNAQSISNDQSLRDYVYARRNECNLQHRTKSRSSLDHDVDAIPDLDLQIRIRLLVEKYRITQKRFRILTQALGKLKPALDLDTLFMDEKATESLGKTSQVSRDQIDALQRVLSVLCDPERLRRAGLEVDSGDIIGQGLRETVVEAQDIELLQMLLKVLDKGIGSE